MENIYDEYAVLESQIAALEAKKAQLRPHILQKMIDEKTKSLDLGVGKLIVAISKKWSYPKEVQDVVKKLKAEEKNIKEEIKTVQAKAESSNLATCEEVPSLRFLSAKL